jgi:hypothetical protein
MSKNFFKGASLDDPHSLFNAGLEAKASRAAVAVNPGKPKAPRTQKRGTNKSQRA